MITLPEVSARVTEMGRGLMQSFLNATVWRVAWSLPLKLLLTIAAVIFLILAVWK